MSGRMYFIEATKVANAIALDAPNPTGAKVAFISEEEAANDWAAYDAGKRQLGKGVIPLYVMNAVQDAVPIRAAPVPRETIRSHDKRPLFAH